MTQDRPLIDIQKVVGGGYNRFMNSRDMFCVVKGSKGSKKSKTAAIKIVSLIMQYPMSNALCVRRVRDTLLDSVFADIGWAIDKLQVNHLWKKSRNPMRYTYRPNDPDYQTILFKGMDKAEKLASITADHGFLNFVWIEEAFELTNDEEFEKLQMSIRGQLPPGYFKQIIMTFNPWSELSWLKERFFDRQAPDSFVDTTTFRDNEFLDEVDIRRYLDLYETNPRRARVVCDGDWGVSEGLIYENWEVDEFDIEALKDNPDIKLLYGLDFGWSAYTAFVACGVDIKRRSIYVFDEWYQTKQTALDIAKAMIQRGYGHEKIVADCAQPESIFVLRTGNGLSEETSTGVVVTYSLPNMVAAVKGADSIDYGIQFIQSFRIHIHPRCSNFMKEIAVYAYDVDKDGKSTGKPIDEYNHGLDGWRYSIAKEYLESGSGYVAEAGGITGMGKYEKQVDTAELKPAAEQMFARRVYSTSPDDYVDI